MQDLTQRSNPRATLVHQYYIPEVMAQIISVPNSSKCKFSVVKDEKVLKEMRSVNEPHQIRTEALDKLKETEAWTLIALPTDVDLVSCYQVVK
jgi:hypothetical protein